MSNQLGNTSVKDFDFDKATNLSLKEDGFTFKIGEAGLLDTKFGVMAVLINKDNGEQLYTSAEVIVNAIRTSINKDIKLVNRIVALKTNESSNFDDETGEFYRYLTLEHATPAQRFEWNEARKAENVEKRKAYEARTSLSKKPKSNKE